MAWYEHILGVLAMATCAGWSLLFLIALAKSLEGARNDEAHRKELKRWISKMDEAEIKFDI